MAWWFLAGELFGERAELIRWLYERWQELDDWVGEMRAGGSPAAAAAAV